MEKVPGKVLLARGLRQRCPVCGRGAVFHSHFKMNRTCPVCHVIFWKQPGESLGAMYLDWAVAVGAFLVTWLIADLTLNLSEMAQLVLFGAVAAASVIICYPLTRSIWTVLVYISGGIEPPPIHVVGRRGKRPG